jgi:hypothetical protein
MEVSCIHDVTWMCMCIMCARSYVCMIWLDICSMCMYFHGGAACAWLGGTLDVMTCEASRRARDHGWSSHGRLIWDRHMCMSGSDDVWYFSRMTI